MRIRIRIQQLKLMRIHADPDPDTDPDPKPWSLVAITAAISLLCYEVGVLTSGVSVSFCKKIILTGGRRNQYSVLPGQVSDSQVQNTGSVADPGWVKILEFFDADPGWK